MQNMNTACRTCLKHDVVLTDLYQSVAIDENYFQLADLLVQCTTAEVSKDDGLPQNICEECTETLQIAYTFRIQVNKNQEKLKQVLFSVKTEPIDIDLKTELHVYEDFNDDDTKTEFTDYYDKSITTEKKPKVKESKKFCCNLCNKAFKSELLLNKHLTKHLCNDSLDSTEYSHSEEILIKTEKDDSNVCIECGQSFVNRRSLANHMKKHKPKLKNKQFVCDVCGRAFKGKQLLKRHLETHNENKKHKCIKCSRTFTRKDQLMVHLRSHRDEKPYVCTYCNKGFTQLCSLKDHVRCHTGETPFLCSQCGKAFSCNSNLRQHMLRHTGIKPFACNLCPKTFCTKGQMQSHVASHSGIHPYKCEVCGASFTKASSLKKHSLIHLGLRAFACETCNQRFTSKDHLKRHNRIHTGEKPYQCTYCERAFTQSNDLVKHIRSHVGQNIYQCTICSNRFRLKSELTQHYSVHFLNGDQQSNPQNHPEELPQDLPRNIPQEIPQDLPRNLPQEIPQDTGKLRKLILKPNQNYPLINNKPNESTQKVEFPLILDNDKQFPSYNNSEDNRITITINSCEDGVVNGITINMPET